MLLFSVVNSEMSPATGGFFNFDVFGAACTEAELDVLTGNYIIRQMNVLYDCGTRYGYLSSFNYMKLLCV